jgi:signal transduction histidine kinase
MDLPPSQAVRPWRGLLVQLFVVAIAPLAVLVVLVTVGSLTLHQNAMRTMVGERDERAVRAAAAALSNELTARLEAVGGLAQQVSSLQNDQLAGQLAEVSGFLEGFDGVAVFSAQGDRLASTGTDQTWMQLSEAAGWMDIFALARQTARLSDDLTFNLAGERFAMAAAPSPDGRYIVVGLFAPGRLTEKTLQEAYILSDMTNTWVIDAHGQVIFDNDPSSAPDDQLNHPGAAEALAGQSGTVYTRVGQDEHVVAFSPVPPLAWALLIEESWEMVTSPALETTQMAPLVAVAVLLLALVALWFGVQQIVHPLQQLEKQATELGWGNFQAIEKPVGGIAEIHRLQTELIHLSRKVQAAQKSLRSYIGAITAGQEEERRRLARELHDDTIQSLIALKQRLQLSQMNAQDPAAAGSLRDLEELSEETIQNLRRLIRDLRPIYLEDLGLVTALEMMAREQQELNKIQVHFKHQGAELRLPAAVELAIYRIVQEALNNISRHAQASQAWISVSFTPQELQVQVRDDGLGYEMPKTPAEFAANGHYGLLGMHERAELIGARLAIQSSPGKGAEVNITMPLSS